MFDKPTDPSGDSEDLIGENVTQNKPLVASEGLVSKGIHSACTRQERQRGWFERNTLKPSPMKLQRACGE